MTRMWHPVKPSSPTHRLPKQFSESIGTTLYVGVNVSTYYFDLQTMVELDFKGMSKYKSNVDIAFFMLEVACYTNEVLVTDPPTKELRLERYGIGFRIGVANWGIKFSASATLAAVAANAALNLSRTAIEVQVLGAGLDTLPIIKPITQLTTFDGESLRIISQCGTALADYFAKNAASLTPVLMAIAPLPVSDFNAFNSSYSSQFATEAIYRGKSQDQALAAEANYPDGNIYIVPGLVATVYNELGVGENVPDSKQRKLANTILDEGRF